MRAPRVIGRKSAVLLGLLTAGVVLWALFDWNWFRGSVEHYFSERTQRKVAIGHLHVDLSLVPTVRLRDVYVENAPWAAARRPFVKAGEVSITFSLESVWQGRPVISRMVLIDADVDLERRADGLRNWRLRNPENREPGRTKVLVLEAQRSQLRFANEALKLELLATSTPAQTTANALPQSAAPRADLNTLIRFEGSYQGAPFNGAVLHDGKLSFRESGVEFPLRGHFVSGRTRIELDGRFRDVFDVGPFDTQLRVTGPSLALLHPFVRIRPPPSREFDVSSRVIQKNAVYTFADIKGRVGDTDLSGTAVFDRSRKRPLLRAELASATADVEDLRALTALRPSGSDRTRAGGEATRAAQRSLFSQREFNVEKLRSVDVNVALNARKLKAANVRMLDSLKVRATLTAGLLELSPLEIGIAGGHLTGTVTFDTRQQPPASHAAMDLRNLRLERIVPTVSQKAGASGLIRGRVDVKGRGNSMAAMAANANGTFVARMESGTISNLVDAKLGLDFGKVLTTLLRGERLNTIHCGLVRFDIAGSVAKARTIALDTDLTYVRGAGTVNLAREQVDLLLTPEAKQPGLFTRRASIRVQGPFSAVQTSVVERVEPLTGSAGCAPRPG